MRYFLSALMFLVLCQVSFAEDPLRSLFAFQAQLVKAGDNRVQLEQALKGVRPDCREGMKFLIRYMPQRDLTTLTSDFLINNVHSAYDQWNTSKWKDQVPKDVFLNNVLPYASINERRDDWRQNFQQRFGAMVAEADSPGLAGAILNQKIFKTLGVKYSTKRRKADQAPFESIESGLASCTGLSVLLIDACRANGVPARFVGTPLWSDRSGNHSWVEIWDKGSWHFTGAAEANGNNLDKAWFGGRASKAQRDERMHAIYAISFKHTPTTFPMVWNRSIKDIYAVNVTDRYTKKKTKIPAGHVSVMFVARKKGEKDRTAVDIKLTDSEGKELFEGRSKDESFDANDHVIAIIPQGQFILTHDHEGKVATQQLNAKSDGQLFKIEIE